MKIRKDDTFYSEEGYGFSMDTLMANKEMLFILGQVSDYKHVQCYPKSLGMGSVPKNISVEDFRLWATVIMAIFTVDLSSPCLHSSYGNIHFYKQLK